MWEGRETLPCPSLHLHYWPIALTWALGRAALLSMGLVNAQGSSWSRVWEDHSPGGRKVLKC